MDCFATGNRYFLPFTLLLAVLVLAGPPRARGQESRELNIGPMHFITNEGFTAEQLQWPWLRPGTDVEMLQNHGIIIGARRAWTDPNGTQWPVQIAQVARNKFSNITDVIVPVKGGFKRTFRNPPSEKVLDGLNWTPFFERQDESDPNLPADVVIYQKANAWPAYGMGIQLERWTYAFANEDLDDFIILEYLLTNTSSEPRNDVYLGLTAQTSGHAQYPGDLWGNYYGASYSRYAAGDLSADSVRAWYSWDAGTPVTGVDTRGEPDQTWGNLREPQYMAYTVIHADRSASDESDDPEKPVKAGWSQRQKSPDLNSNTQQEVYDFLHTNWSAYVEGGYSITVDSDGNEVSNNQGMYRILSPGFNPNNFDPVTEQEKSALFSFGPYQLQAGENFRVVVAFAGGSIPHRLAIDTGRSYKNGYTQQREAQPLPYDVFDPDGNLIAPAGQFINQEQKDAIIGMGKTLALQNAGKARSIWNNSNVRAGQGSFGISYAPAAPSLEGISEGDQVHLIWDNNNQDGRGGPINAWRIYREYKRPPSLTSPTDTTFLLLSEVPAGTSEFIDGNVVRGEQYYYYVTGVNANGIESSPFQNRTGLTATKTDEALTARSPAVTQNWQDQIVVVPNPYHTQAARKYPGRRLNFLNLPPYARIHIYTVTGDRVQTIDHDVNAGDEDWLRQDTFSSTEIVSGVYLYVIEKLDAPGGQPNGEQAIGKFVVIK